MATPPTAVTVVSQPSVHQVPPGKRLPCDNQQLHNVMIQQQLPQVVHPPPYQQLGSTATVQYVVSSTINLYRYIVARTYCQSWCAVYCKFNL